MTRTPYLFWVFIAISCFACQQAATFATDAKTIDHGRQLFELQCSACHNFRSSGLGPNLSGITTEVSTDWIRAFIKAPIAMIEKGDERAVKQFKAYKTYMPAFNHIPEEDLSAILAFLHTQQEKTAFTAATDFGEPVENPILERIASSGKVLSLREITTAPPTAEKRPLTRINKMRGTRDGRTFIHDLRGTLYELKDGDLHSFLELPDYFPNFIDRPGQGTGLGSFAFHPDFAKNGLFYTTHTEDPGLSKAADFGYADSIPITVRFVLTEWRQQDPSAPVFSGTSRELLRMDMVDRLHGVQEIAFNLTARAGEPDYGKLYICIGDGGSVENGYAFLVESKSRPWGKILRIDPAGNNSKNGNYGIPTDNPFYAEISKGALGEIWAMGFRNPNQICWDTGGDGKMLASDIGHRQIEEVNIIEKGRNYGWPEREGTFRINKSGNLDIVYPLAQNDGEEGFTYPAAQFDHDDAAAICAGLVYYGEAIPALRGKYLFGGIVNGRIFSVDAASLELDKQAKIEEIYLQLEEGPIIDLRTLTSGKRVDLRFGSDANGELYIFTKVDGKIYRAIQYGDHPS